MAVKMLKGASAVPATTSKSGPSSPGGVTNKTTALPDGGCMPSTGGKRSKQVFT